MVTSCDREPIHRPDAIQPYGLLLIADAKTLSVIAGAGHIEERLASDWLGQALPSLLGISRARLETPHMPSLSDVRVKGLNGETFSAIRRNSDSHVYVELEPLQEEKLLTWDIFGEIDATAERFELCPDITEVCHKGAQIFRQLMGYDRVVVYRFLEDGSGQVIAESRSDALPTLLNHHFPASDIPRQARQLYIRNRIRVIPDVSYEAAPIRPQSAGLSGMDMSDVQLRSVSPVHLQYMKNMGIAASASVSLIVDGVLWGLIACHNVTPRQVGEDVRAACRTLAGVMARQLRNKEELVTYQERLRLRNAMEFLSSRMDTQTSVLDSVRALAPDLQTLFPCDGFAIVCGTEVFKSGILPEKSNILLMRDWLRLKSNYGVFSTSNLEAVFPGAAQYPELSAGVLAITLPFQKPIVLIWSRIELIETIEWAGNPHKAGPDEQGNLHPRTSFKTWEQTVRGRAPRWNNEQIQAARRLRRTLIEDHQNQQLRELNHTLNTTLQERENLLQQKDFLIREVNHRVQNSLQMVTSFLKLQTRGTSNEETAKALGEAQNRISAIGLVHRRLYRDDHFGLIDLARYLEELMQELCLSLGEGWKQQLRLSLVSVLISADRAINVGLLLTELVINTSKYAYNGAAGPLRICLTQVNERIVLTVADQGQNSIKLESSQGFGTRMMKAVVSSLSGVIAYNNLSPGLQAVITIPIEISQQQHDFMHPDPDSAPQGL
ncbi:GAF domain-containing protein [Gluconobacter wancherniae]|nr:GAF domain-containing protein [Gluconobacter wancherniae]